MPEHILEERFDEQFLDGASAFELAQRARESHDMLMEQNRRLRRHVLIANAATTTLAIGAGLLVVALAFAAVHFLLKLW